MFQLVDAPDGDAAGGAYFINFYAGVRVVVQYQLGCSFHGLRHHAHAVLGVDAHFDAGLHGCLDVLQYVCDAAGSHGSGGGEFFFGDEQGKAHLVEDVQHQLFLLRGGVAAGDERHALHFADGGVGDDAEHGHFLVGHVLCQFFEGDAGGNGDKYLFAFQLQLAQHGLDEPGLHGEYDEFGAGDGFLIVVSGLQGGEFGFQLVQFALRGVRNDDIAGGNDASLCQSAGDGAAHVSGSDDCCFHIILLLKGLTMGKGRYFFRLSAYLLSSFSSIPFTALR